MPNSPQPSPQEARNRETALFHADIIRQRKDVESLILFATETLLDFPPSPDSNPGHPAPKDATVANTLLKSFQPVDFDALIEERNIDKKCGYIFCLNLNRQQDTNARCRILRTKGEGTRSLKFVDRRLLERWCSDECGRRALFVRVQLNEEPAWMRVVDSGEDIKFLEDEDSSTKSVNGDLADQLQMLNVASEVDGMAAALDQLAIERGDGQAHSKRSVLVEVNVHENIELQDPMLVEPKQKAI